ncbi:MAG: hypothetical protein II625_06195 [Bacilli bacterium]|nr:hypothetical protein [Bacilli bacterium]
MNDEIKEILAYFEEYVKITDMHDSEPMLNWKDLKIVLDYITNLQQENKKLSKQHLATIDKLIETQQRIEKAVEYIEKSKEINYKTIDTLSEEVKLLKGILNGENVMLNNILNILNGKE